MSSKVVRESLLEGIGCVDPSDGIIIEKVRVEDWWPYHSKPSWVGDYRHISKASFNLPVDADRLYFHARGSRRWLSGTFEIHHSPRIAQGHVKVDVLVAYDWDEVLAKVAVCRVKKETNMHGIILYTPAMERRIAVSRSELAFFSVVFTFPADYGDGPLAIKSFRAEVDSFRIATGDLWDKITFDDFHINAWIGDVNAESITFKEGSITTVNDSIKGHYNASRSLRLETLRGAISGSVSLLNEGEEEAKLALLSTSGGISSTIALSSDKDWGGRFKVEAKSPKGDVTVKYAELPPEAILESDVSTSKGKVTVDMDRAFEGSFEVSSSELTPTLNRWVERDPAARGRQRLVKYTKEGNVIRGRCWTKQREELIAGYTKISTDGKAELTI